jgi:hypothetical protein
VKDDEGKFQESVRESAEQLLTLFESDAVQSEEPSLKRRAAGSMRVE